MDLVDTYGGGRFDNYLWLLEPGCANRYYELGYVKRERDEALELLWGGGEPRPEQLDMPGTSVIPWGVTDNGEVLYWLLAPAAAADGWTVLINEARGERWEHLRVGCSEALVGLLSGEIHSEILSSSFPLIDHEFRPTKDF
jgi:hypothetical protein